MENVSRFRAYLENEIYKHEELLNEAYRNNDTERMKNNELVSDKLREVLFEFNESCK